MTARHIRNWTRRDTDMSQVLQYIERGWPSTCDKSLSTYSAKRSELSVFQGCIMWGSRVIIPPKGRSTVLQELHKGHPGMTKMKALARMYVWWPLIDKDIELSVQKCYLCQQQQSAPPVAPLQPWKWPSRPWVRLHMGLCWSIPRQDDSYCCRFSFKMDRSLSHRFFNIKQSNRIIAHPVCSVWTTGSPGNRQWLMFCE